MLLRKATGRLILGFHVFVGQILQCGQTANFFLLPRVSGGSTRAGYWLEGFLLSRK